MSHNGHHESKFEVQLDEGFERLEHAAAILVAAATALWVLHDLADEVRGHWREVRRKSKPRRLRRPAAEHSHN